VKYRAGLELREKPNMVQLPLFGVAVISLLASLRATTARRKG
jgi:hypothetical protein